MKKEFVRNPYNYDSDELSEETGLFCPEKTLAQQQFLEESDINYIAARFMKTGELPQVADMPTSGDFQGVFDFQSAMNLIVDAKQKFMELPAKIRSRFNNDPAQLIKFLEDDTQEAKDEAIALGLRKRPEPPRIDLTQATAPQPSTPPSVAPGPSSPEKPSKPEGK